MIYIYKYLIIFSSIFIISCTSVNNKDVNKTIELPVTKPIDKNINDNNQKDSEKNKDNSNKNDEKKKEETKEEKKENERENKKDDDDDESSKSDVVDKKPIDTTEKNSNKDDETISDNSKTSESDVVDKKSIDTTEKNSNKDDETVSDDIKASESDVVIDNSDDTPIENSNEDDDKVDVNNNSSKSDVIDKKPNDTTEKNSNKDDETVSDNNKASESDVVDKKTNNTTEKNSNKDDETVSDDSKASESNVVIDNSDDTPIENSNEDVDKIDIDSDKISLNNDLFNKIDFLENEKEKGEVKTPNFRVDYNVYKDNTNYIYPDKEDKFNSVNIEPSNYDSSNEIHIFEAQASNRYFEPIRDKISGINLVNHGARHSSAFRGTGNHPYFVTLAFLEGGNYNKQKINYEIPENLVFHYYTSGDVNTHTNLRNVKGIVNQSYGLVQSHERLIEFEAISNYYDKAGSYLLEREFFSNRLFDPTYRENNQLRIISGGNNETSSILTFWAVKNMHTQYAKLSSELQKLARSEILLAKNMISDEIKEIYDNSPNFRAFTVNTYTDSLNRKWYEINTNEGSHNAKPILLRSFTAVMPGFVATDSLGIQVGSSYSAPRVSRLAYEIKKKFPFLSYNQVKQTILTSAVNDNSGYLSNIAGFGIIDYEKALNGPSSFNAGLIDEQAFYLGNYDKIYDDEKNTYFYVNIENGKYEFSNDIDSGLSGDGTTNDYMILYVNGKRYGTDTVNLFETRVPLVLDSERRFYKNVAQAGLRKDGKGELVLSGIQYYTAKSQVLDGTLILKNHSNSSYEIFEPATLKIDGENISIAASIKNSGTVDFNANTKLNEYIASKNSTTKLHIGKIVETDKFFSSGNIFVELDKAENISALKNLVIANNIDLKNSHLENSFLSINIDKNKILSIEFANESDKKLKDLTKEELRNIPSYDVNRKDFFEKYIYTKNYRLYNLDGNENKFVQDMVNFRSFDNDKAKAQIFTDIYSSNVKDLLENHYIFNDSITNEILNKIKNRYEINFLTSFISNIDKDDKYSVFNKNMISNSLILKYALNKDNSISSFISYSKLNNNYYKVNSNIKNEILGLGLSYSFKDFNAKLFIQKINSNTKRKINDYNIYSENKAYITDLEFLHKFNFKLNEKNNIFLTNSIEYTNISINDFSEKNDNNFNFLISFKNNSLNKLRLKTKLTLNTEITNNINIQNEFSLSKVINENIVLNANILDKDTSLETKDINTFNIDYAFSLNYSINKNLDFKIKFEINNIKKLNFLINFKYSF